MKKILIALSLILAIGTAVAFADDVIAKNGKIKVYANTDATKVVSEIGEGIQGECLDEVGDFYHIKLADGTTGYVFKGESDRIKVTYGPAPQKAAGDAAKTDAPDADEAAAEADAPAAEADAAAPAAQGDRATFPCGKKKVTVGKKTYDVADIYDERTVYKTQGVTKANLFAVVSKQEYRLYVYEKVGADTVLVAHYPVCYARNTGQKTRTGDSTTPEGSMSNYFTISEILNASSWRHDFKDGRGNMLAYGHWFMRLNLSKATNLNAATRSNRSIGIHGSTNNRASVPGNDSEGCIRLRDEDIIHFHDNFARVGMKIVVKPYTQGKYAFETKAQKALGKRYYYATKGYKQYPAK